MKLGAPNPLKIAWHSPPGAKARPGATAHPLAWRLYWGQGLGVDLSHHGIRDIIAPAEA